MVQICFVFPSRITNDFWTVYKKWPITGRTGDYQNRTTHRAEEVTTTDAKVDKNKGRNGAKINTLPPDVVCLCYDRDFGIFSSSI